jgi:hypothetical protein
MDANQVTLIVTLAGAILTPLVTIAAEEVRDALRRRAGARESHRIYLPPSVRPSRAKRRLRPILLLFAGAGALLGYFLSGLLPASPEPLPPTATATEAASPTARAQPESSLPVPLPPPSTAAVSVPTTPPPPVADACIGRGQLIYEETFSSDDTLWSHARSIQLPYTLEDRSIVDGSYRLFASFTYDALTTIPIPYLSRKNFHLTLTATVVQRSGDGPLRIAVSFRRDQQGYYYVARFSDDGTYSLFLRSPDGFIPILDWTPTTAFDLSPDTPNEFAIVAADWIVTLCANGQELDTTLDSGHNVEGQIGIGLSGVADLSGAADFDDITVRTVP